MARAQTGWQLRFRWDVDPAITHPELTYDDRFTSRERAEQVAWIRWPRHEQGMSMIEICVRKLPDGEWEHLLPLPATCGLPPDAPVDGA